MALDLPGLINILTIFREWLLKGATLLAKWIPFPAENIQFVIILLISLYLSSRIAKMVSFTNRGKITIVLTAIFVYLLKFYGA